MVKHVLLIVNTSAGAGTDDQVARRLFSLLREKIADRADVHLRSVNTHAQAADAAREFLAGSPEATAILAGGGGGTMRAIIEAVCEHAPPANLPGRNRVRLGTLRLGSGNLLAKQLAIPADPEAALAGLADNLLAGQTVPGCVVSCRADGRRLFAIGLGGFGWFGRVAGDVARLRQHWPRWHCLAAALVGLEGCNHAEYCLAVLGRAWSCFRAPAQIDEVEVLGPGFRRTMRLLAGVVTNFPLPDLPFEAGVRLEEAAFTCHLVPYVGRWQTLQAALSHRHAARHAVRVRLDGQTTLKLRLAGGTGSEFFLDEDPEVFHDELILTVAGVLDFIPGRDFRPAGVEAGACRAA
jgi:hypothetical protein